MKTAIPRRTKKRNSMTFVRSPNQQDLSWFIDMQTQGRLELDPPYQRKSVWTYKDKQFFLDTIFNNYPCPAVYLQKENTVRGPLYNVVDGKQRLSTILDFHAGKIRLSKNFEISRLRGKKFGDLSEEDVSSFYNYIFMVEQIRSDNQVDWGEVFQRVNKNQKKLGEQELRHARFDGWLINKAESEVVQDPLWKTLGISSSARSKRMKDVEFVSILMLVMLEEDFVGFPQDRIDELYAKYDFKLEEIPETEDEAVLNDEFEETFSGASVEAINAFEDRFAQCRGIISNLEAYNQCITKHKRRITTDLYSLWAAIVLEPAIYNMDIAVLAAKFDEFISNVDKAYSLTRDGQSIDEMDSRVQLYFGNSTGAATEVDNRKKRHSALVEYLQE